MARTSVFERLRNASRDQLLHHAHNLETEMRILAKLLEVRDNQGMRTTTSAEAVNRAQALTQVAVSGLDEVADSVCERMDFVAENAAELFAILEPFFRKG